MSDQGKPSSTTATPEIETTSEENATSVPQTEAASEPSTEAEATATVTSPEGESDSDGQSSETAPQVEASQAETPAETVDATAEEPKTEEPPAEAASEAKAESEEAPAEAAEPTAEATAGEATPEAAATAEATEATAGEATPEAAATAEAGQAEEAKAEEAKAESTDNPDASQAKAKAKAKASIISGADGGVPAQADLEELQKAMETKAAIKGQVIGWNKGGYHVAIGKTAAFCPVSQIEIGNPRSPKRYLDKTFPFNVIEIQRGGRRVVVSRAEALKQEREARAALVRERLKPGTELEGKVSSLTDFGAFVDVGGGIEGLVHVSEISRRRIEHPKEFLKRGQEVKVTVLKIEKGGQRISLSMKRLEEDPWKGVAERFTPGTKFSGTILRKTDFGLFVEVEPGLEGLVHRSRLPLGLELSAESLEVGQTVEGWVHDVESKRRRLSLSLREVAAGNPWSDIEERFPIGNVFDGKVERLANFGAFVELEPGLTGLLPFSTIGLGPGSNPRRQFHPGKEVRVRVLSIDRQRKRISLGTESSKAEGTHADYKDYLQNQGAGSGMTTLAAAFQKLKG